jgi:hypothetical protein
MENGHFLRNVVLTVAGVVVVGLVAWWVIQALLGIVFYVIVGALIVGGAIYVTGRAKRAIRGGGRNQIRR